MPTGVVLGFEPTNFTVEEEDGFVELCVSVFEPPVFDPVTPIGDIIITTCTQDGTAGNTAGMRPVTI